MIVVPPSVAEELARHEICVATGWMHVIAVQNRRELASLRQQLDPGEAEAILVDEQRGRRVAAEHGLAVMGLLGVLARAGFWIGDDPRSRYLLGVGENPLPPFTQDDS